ncbi:type IX secretion system sortase PorU [Flavobacterium sp.]|uniref:type IX secretion system sortase PorU n=1 Tax=Flavobacterium sp. TaxID=239 RepID=UPI002B4AD18F|nr:type IX secretion system sortase PorU [Flavobacterium sp.]HLF51295.1 type IX secretion system sortase PorU [Flavobacterium sp.]
MRKTLASLFTLLSFACFAQQKGDVILEWIEQTEISYGTYKMNVPQFKSDSFYFDSYKKELFFNLNLPQSTTIDESSLQITNTVYEPILASQLGDLSVAAIPNEINATIRNVNARDKKFAFLSLSPIIKDGNGFKKLKSFNYSFSSGSSRTVQSANNTSAITNSVLATGDWYRFYVEKSGVYKISKGFLSQLGLNTNGDPRKIKIYGNGGRMLPLLNSTIYPLDLAENAIQIIGENDGVFNDADYILFYAEGVDNWNEDSRTHNNLYASKSYYYVTLQGGDGKRMSEMQQPTGTTTLPISTFDDYLYHELDLVNIVRTGRTWYGEQFNIDNEQEFEFKFPNINAISPIEINVHAATAAFTATTFKIEANNSDLGSFSFDALVANGGNEAFECNQGLGNCNSQYVFQKNFPATENTTVKITYDNNGVPGSKGFLDYIILKAKSNLKGYGKQFRFQYNQASTLIGIGEYQFANASGINQIWDITDIYNTAKVENSNQSSFSFKANLGEVRKYIAVDALDYYTPLKESQSKVVNQDLKGTVFKNVQGQFQDIDYLIVVPAFLNTQAEKLAVFHRNYSQLNVKVVNLETIYQEFSSGKQDIAAIRNFVKYIYENASIPEKKIKYLNLFGDASFDFQDRIPNNTNIVPIYHSLNSNTAGESSFATDDFFGLMDSNQGNIISYAEGIDVTVGRMIVSSNQQAEEMVNKVIEYHDLKSYGNWRNNCVFISDDSDSGHEDGDLQFRQNQLADKVSLEKPFINVKKIILDSYVQETSSGGSRYPKAREEIFNAFEKGALVFNYLGHGGEDGLSGERIWEKSDGQNLSNRYKYPLFITITCDFSRFDNPFRPTAGEYTYWNPKGGAISMLTTIRSIGKSSAENFNDKLSEYLFSYGSNEYPSIAEALRLAKNSTPNSSSNVVFYLGDPAVMLAIPKPKIRLTKVNDAPVTGPIDDFQSLAFVKLTGEITDEFNTPLASYNGELSVNIFDKNISKSTLNNDGTSPSMNFNVLGETIFRGNASVTNGQFEFGFVVPRDIKIPLGNGRISFYAKRDQILLDKTGYDTTIKIGGINPTAVADNIGPRVKLFMNDQTFISGGITNESPIFLAFLEDENGINTASGIGHDIVAILDGNESNPYILNDYYETELDNYKKGKLQFPLRNLAVGLHTITFKAWDVYNNPITAEIQFIVVGDETVTLTNVLNYPNPFVSYTQFWFTHNRPFEPLEVQVQVMTITGKIVWSKNQIVTTDGFLSREITWDGRDDFGDKIGKGVYVYKLTVKSNLTNKKSEKFEKLVIL